MLYWLGVMFQNCPLRLFMSHLVLMAVGTLGAGFLVWFFLPRMKSMLPRDRGKAQVKDGEKSRGKPTGGGYPLTLLILPMMFFAMPLVNPWEAGILACIFLAMYTGYLDDKSALPWGELRKGFCDFVIALLAAVFVCQMQNPPTGEEATLFKMHDVVIWLPFVRDAIPMAWEYYLPMATVLLWFTVNATNCSDGVDGLAGSLTLIALVSLAALLYGIVGYKPVADYLLIPHSPSGARWAVMLFTAAGGLAGYLWYNAEPSSLLMGDAGSRMLGLLVGVGVLASGNPLLVFVVSPVILANGGAGLCKLVLLRLLKRMGFDTTPPDTRADPSPQHVLVRALHSVRFPLHDHCRRNLGWSNAQVLMRFMLIQAFLTPLLFILFVKVR